MRYLLISLCLWAIVSLYGADGEEVEIKGGFGYVLGEDGSKIKGTQINEDTIEVQAKSSFRSFNKCLIELNEEKLIYTISARATFDTEKDTDRELKIVLNLLEKKYKATFEDTTSRSTKSPDQIFYSLRRGNKNITLIKQGKKALRINYWDSEMNNSQRARKKRALEQQNNNNTDAL